MRKNMLSFALGAVVMLLLICLPVTALAASGAIKIEVAPIKVLVNGEAFQPKDANGNDVMIFTYNGTTYAPLRALAEAYGLEVGYDEANHIATVNAKPAAGLVSPGTEPDNLIGEERARSVALEKVPGVDASHIRKFKLDHDDGRWEYEVEIWYNGMEYEVEIDAVTGKVLKFETERH